MGEVELRSYLQSCDRNREDLQRQSDYAESSGKRQRKKAQGTLQDLNRSFASQKERSHKKANETVAEYVRLGNESRSLQRRRSQLDTEYSKAYAEWFQLTAELSQKMARLHGCNCKEERLLLSQRRQLGRMAPDKKIKYDLMTEVEKCEAESKVISNDLAAQQDADRKAVVKASEDMDTLKRRMADSERLAKLSELRPLVSEQTKQRDILKSAVDSQEAHVSDYRKRNKDLKWQNLLLEEELHRCGC